VDASTSAAIEVRFSQPMVPGSVEERFTVEPPLDGALSWPDPQTLRFQPDELLTEETEYVVRLSPGVRTARGVILPWGARLPFATGHPTLLYLVVPPDGEGQINLWQIEHGCDSLVERAGHPVCPAITPILACEVKFDATISSSPLSRRLSPA
jgi:hypothetical protein